MVAKKLDYTIVNLVASSSFDQNLDLYNLAVSLQNVEYEPEQFPGAIMKLKEPKVSLLLFKNGKIICSGASSTKQIEDAIRKAMKIIHEVQPDLKIKKKVSFTIVNLVATGALNKNLDLFEVAMDLDNIEYEPEQFPGAILRLTDPELTSLVFKNGKIICAGAKTIADLEKGLAKVKRIFSKVGTKTKNK
jgi:transcription initiation factor TFIID TATA-box-binding protein